MLIWYKEKMLNIMKMRIIKNLRKLKQNQKKKQNPKQMKKRNYNYNDSSIYIFIINIQNDYLNFLL